MSQFTPEQTDLQADNSISNASEVIKVVFLIEPFLESQKQDRNLYFLEQELNAPSSSCQEPYKESLDHRLSGIKSIIGDLLPEAEVQIIKEQEQYGEYYEFIVTVEEVDDHESLAKIFMEAHRQIHLQIKPEIKYSITFTK